MGWGKVNLADIDAGLLDCVVIYQVDRLSRSLLDFARIMQRFKNHNIHFVSVTQHFNTADSMGCLTLGTGSVSIGEHRPLAGAGVRMRISHRRDADAPQTIPVPGIRRAKR